MNFSIRFFNILLAAFIFVGCQRPMENPESIDPIYKDIKSTLDKKEKELADELKKQADALKDIQRAEPRTLQLKILRKDYSLSSQTIHRLKQEIDYLKIRAERRLWTDRMTYNISFKAKKEWPDPREYSDYQVNKRLNEASRQWSTRVPRLSDRYPSSKGGKAAPKEEGAASAPAAEH